MSDKYDSILKEKKVYKDYTEPHVIFKRFMAFGIFLALVIVVISYFVYYNTFLNGDTILLNNFVKILDNYSVITKGLNSGYDFSNSYVLSGTVSSNGIKYDYKLIRDNNKTERVFSNNKNVSFYYDGDANYIKLSHIDKYISLDNELLSIDDYKSDIDMIKGNVFDYFYSLLFDKDIINIYNRFYTIDNHNEVLNDIRNNFLDYVSENSYSKKFYFYNGRPVVKIDISIDSKGINKILGNGNNNLLVKDDYNVIISSKNDAIMNDIKNFKIIVNNKTNNTRSVISYDGNDLFYTDKDGVEYKYNLNLDNDKFNLRIYKDSVLYTALEGYKEGNKYVYNYQFIDKYERYTLEVLYEGNKYNYKLLSSIDRNEKTITIDGEYTSDGIIDIGNIDVLLYRDISDSDRAIINNKLINYLK